MELDPFRVCRCNSYSLDQNQESVISLRFHRRERKGDEEAVAKNFGELMSSVKRA